MIAPMLASRGEVEEEEQDAATGENASDHASSGAPSLVEGIQLVLDNAATFGAFGSEGPTEWWVDPNEEDYSDDFSSPDDDDREGAADHGGEDAVSSYQSCFEVMQQIIDEGLTLPNQAAPSRERRYAHWPELKHARVCWFAITWRLWHEYTADLTVGLDGHTEFDFHTMQLSGKVGAFVNLPRDKMILAARSIIFGPAPRIPPTASA